MNYLFLLQAPPNFNTERFFNPGWLFEALTGGIGLVLLIVLVFVGLVGGAHLLTRLSKVSFRK